MLRQNRRAGGVDQIGITEGGTGFTTMEDFRAGNSFLSRDDSRVIKLDAEGKLPTFDNIEDMIKSLKS